MSVEILEKIAKDLRLKILKTAIDEKVQMVKQHLPSYKDLDLSCLIALGGLTDWLGQWSEVTLTN